MPAPAKPARPTRAGAAAAASRIDLAAVLAKSGYGAEVRRTQAADLARRETDVARLLGTDAIRDRDIDAARLLSTTLGGQLRAITRDDLETFARAAKRLGKKFAGGVTARGIVEASLQVDRDRANREIRTAIVVRAQAGRLHFVTNAGPDSDVARHHVHVAFPAFASLAGSPRQPKILVTALLASPVKVECDCGRFTFWYRYMATTGGYCHGRLETAFPKIRNPRLTGLACKHLLRVAVALQRDAHVRAKLEAMLAAGQANNTRALVTTTAQARAQAQQQVDTGHHLKAQAETRAQAVLRRTGSPAGARAVAGAIRTAARLAAQQVARTEREAAAAIKKLASLPLTPALRARLAALIAAEPGRAAKKG